MSCIAYRWCCWVTVGWSVLPVITSKHIVLFYVILLIPSVIFALFFSPYRSLDVSQIDTAGSLSSRLFSPLPTTVRAFIFIAKRLQLFLLNLPASITYFLGLIWIWNAQILDGISYHADTIQDLLIPGTWFTVDHHLFNRILFLLYPPPPLPPSQLYRRLTPREMVGRPLWRGGSRLPPC